MNREWGGQGVVMCVLKATTRECFDFGILRLINNMEDDLKSVSVL